MVGDLAAVIADMCHRRAGIFPQLQKARPVPSAPRRRSVRSAALQWQQLSGRPEKAPPPLALRLPTPKRAPSGKTTDPAPSAPRCKTGKLYGSSPPHFPLPLRLRPALWTASIAPAPLRRSNPPPGRRIGTALRYRPPETAKAASLPQPSPVPESLHPPLPDTARSDMPLYALHQRLPALYSPVLPL